MEEPNAEAREMAEEPAEAKQQLANKNGKKAEGGTGGSFFTWFMVLALLGVWTSVAVVWFDLVDYQGVVGKLGSYDVDNDGDFDLEDVQVLLDADVESSIPDTLGNLSEEASGWLYGFFAFVYDIMTPFEIEEEEDEQVGMVTEDIIEFLTSSKAEEQAVKEKVEALEDERPKEADVKQAPREGSPYRDPAGKLKEALKRQLAMIHERIEAKKIARLALSELRGTVAKEEEARKAERATMATLEEVALKARERTEAKLRKVMEKMEMGEMTGKEREEREKEGEKRAKREREESREKARKDKRAASKRRKGHDEDEEDEEDGKTHKKEGKHSKDGRAKHKRGSLRDLGKGG